MMLSAVGSAATAGGGAGSVFGVAGAGAALPLHAPASIAINNVLRNDITSSPG